jgi:hypothetical protein
MAVAMAALTGCNSNSKQAQQNWCNALNDRLAILVRTPSNKAQLTEMLAAFDQLGATVPSVIKDDWTTLGNLFRALQKVDVTQPSVRDQALADAFSQRVQLASSNVDTYTKSTCGIDMTKASNPTTTTAAPTTTASATATTAINATTSSGG